MTSAAVDPDGLERVRAATFYRYAELLPQRVAVIEPDGREVTYGGLLSRVNQVSHALRAAGIEVTDRVAVIVGNTVRFFELALGAAQVGVQMVPVNSHLTAEEIGYIVDNSGSRLVFAEAEFLPRAVEALALAGRADGDLIAVDAQSPHRTFEQFLAGQPGTEPANRVNANALLYTSGTTGRPKGAAWPVSTSADPEQAVAAMEPLMAMRGLRHDPTAVSMVTGPLYHGAPGAWGLQALHRGHTVLLMGKWDSERFLQLVEQYRVTTVQLAPIHFHRLLQLPCEVRDRYDTSSLQVVSHAGAATPVAVKKQVMDWWGPVLWEYYASSEGFGTSISPTDWLAHPGSVGRADGNGATMKVLDESGAELPPGEVGTLWVRNPGGILTSYLGDPEKTAANHRDGFYTVGDMGYIDAEGWLFLVDRRTDLIISGGVNIYPAEVEAALRENSAVADVAVVGLPDPEWGHRVHAVIVPAPGQTPGPELTERILAGVAAAGLARFKVPRSVEFRDSLPYTPTGKLLRRQLRAEAGGGS
jgi:long-chain acyl-CoA synthetase